MERSILLAALLLLLPVAIGLDPELPRPVQAAASPQPHVARPSRRSGRVSAPYAPREIEIHLAQSRLSIAGCFLKDASYPSSRAQVRIGWEGSGAFQKVELQPPGNPQLRSCLQALIEAWPLKPHPGLQPFVYVTTLVLD